MIESIKSAIASMDITSIEEVLEACKSRVSVFQSEKEVELGSILLELQGIADNTNIPINLDIAVSDWSDSTVKPSNDPLSTRKDIKIGIGLSRETHAKIAKLVSSAQEIVSELERLSEMSENGFSLLDNHYYPGSNGGGGWNRSDASC